MDFFNKLLHRNSSGGGGGGSQATSPKPLPVAKAGDSPLQSTSENKYFSLNDGSEIKSPVKSQSKSPVTQNEDKENHHVQSPLEAKKAFDCGPEETEEDKFEDAQENKLSVSMLAEDLNKVHLTTPGRMVPQVDNHEFRDVKLHNGSSCVMDASSSCLYESFVDSEVSFGAAGDSVSARNTSTRSSSTPVRNISRFNVSDHNGQLLLTPKRDDGSGNISVISEPSLSFEEAPRRSSILSDVPEQRSSDEILSPNLRDADNDSIERKLEKQEENGSYQEKVVSQENSQITGGDSLLSSGVSNSVASQDYEKSQTVKEKPVLSSGEILDRTSNTPEEKEQSQISEDGLMLSSIEVCDITSNTSEEKEKSQTSEEGQMLSSSEVLDSNTSQIKETSQVAEKDKMLSSIEIDDITSNSSKNNETSLIAEESLTASIGVQNITSNTSEEKSQVTEKGQMLSSIEVQNISSNSSSEEINSFGEKEMSQIAEENQTSSIEVPKMTSNTFEEMSQISEKGLMLSSIEVCDITSNTSEEKVNSQTTEEGQMLSSSEVSDSNTSQTKETSQVAEKDKMLSSIEIDDITSNSSKNNETSLIAEESLTASIGVQNITSNTSRGKFQVTEKGQMLSSIEVQNISSNSSSEEVNSFGEKERSQIAEENQTSSIEVPDVTSNTSEEKSQISEEGLMLSSIEVCDITPNTSDEKEKSQTMEEGQMFSSPEVFDTTSNTSQAKETSQCAGKDKILSSIEVHDITPNSSEEKETSQILEGEKSQVTEESQMLSLTEVQNITSNSSEEEANLIQEKERSQITEETQASPIEVLDITSNTSEEKSQIGEEGKLLAPIAHDQTSNSSQDDKNIKESIITGKEDLMLSSKEASDFSTNPSKENGESEIVQIDPFLSVNEVVDLTFDTPKPLKGTQIVREDSLSSNISEGVASKLEDSFEIVHLPSVNNNEEVTNSDISVLIIETDISLPPAKEVDEDEFKLSIDSLEVPFVKRKESEDKKVSSSGKPDQNSSIHSSTASIADFEEKLRLEFAKTSQMVDKVLNKEESENPVQSDLLQETNEPLTEVSFNSNKSMNFELSPCGIESVIKIPQESDSNVSEVLCPTSPAEKLSGIELALDTERDSTSETIQPGAVSPEREHVVKKDAEPQQTTNVEPALECEVAHLEPKSTEEINKGPISEIFPPAVKENLVVHGPENEMDVSQPQEIAELEVSSQTSLSQLDGSVEANISSNSLDKVVTETSKPEISDSGLNALNVADNKTESTSLVSQTPELKSKDVEPLTEIVKSEAVLVLETKPIKNISVKGFSDEEQKAAVSQTEIAPTVDTSIDLNVNAGSTESEQVSVKTAKSDSSPKPPCSEIVVNESSLTQSPTPPPSEPISESCLSSAPINLSTDLNRSLNISNKTHPEQIQAEINSQNASSSPQTEDAIPVSEEILDITNSELLTHVPVQSLENIEADLPEVSPIKNFSNNERQKSSAKKTLKSPKPVKSPISKTSPKRNLLNDFKASQTKVSPKTGNSPFCEFYIPTEERTDDAPLEFDERLAEEAANVSEHILNLSQEIMDSDSDENNKTVIVKSPTSKVKPSPKSSVSRFSPTKRPAKGPLQKDVGQSNSIDLLPIESYMQSMRSVVPAHLNQSEAGPITADQLSTQDLEFQDGAHLDLDFFNQVGSSKNPDKTSLSLTRDSLYVKFDPIVGALVSKTVGDEFAMPPPPPPEEEINIPEPQVQLETNSTTEVKQVGQGDAEKTPGRSPALEAVQKLISLTPPCASVNSVHQSRPDRATVAVTPTTTTPKQQHSSPPLSQEQLQRELKKLEVLMKDREISYESELGKKQSEIDKRDTEMETVMLRLAEKEAELKAASEQEHRLKKEVQEKTKAKQQLSLVMEEYEQTISQLVAQKEQEKKSFEVQKDLIMKERDTAMQHLNNMEIAFNDVHQKYERSKTVIEGMKENENELKKSLVEYDEAMKNQIARYETLKTHAIKQLETANQELDHMRRSHKSEIDKLRAMLRKAEVQVTSLEEAMERKLKENQELTAICDELINKVGSGD